MNLNAGSSSGSQQAIRPKETVGEEVSAEDAQGQCGEGRHEKILDPKVPTKEERGDHEITHLPFRNWCRHCIRGRGKEAPAFKSKEDPKVAEIHVDFMFMGEESGGKTLTFLVAKERLSKALMGSVVPSKSTGDFIAKRVVAFMREFGCDMSDINMKTDSEEALRALVDRVGCFRAALGAGRMCIETSPVYSSRSNGVIERGIQSLQGQLRTMRSALEEKLGVVLCVEHGVWRWMTEYATFLLNRGEVGHDGKTAYERCKGKRGKIPGIEFMEAVPWKRRPIGGPLGKLSCMWSDGVFLGVKGSTGEFIVGDERGIWRTRTLRRRPKSERWGLQNLKMVGGVPWRMSSSDPNVDGDEMKLNVTIMDKEYRDKLIEEGEFMDKVPKKFDIAKGDLEKHGYVQAVSAAELF